MQTLTALATSAVRAGVVEGDIETSIDADRLAGLGAQISLLNTGDGFGGECHLDAPMVARALPGAATWPPSTCCSSRTSATWCARPSSTSAPTTG